jgi:hypothetical protein
MCFHCMIPISNFCKQSFSSLYCIRTCSDLKAKRGRNSSKNRKMYNSVLMFFSLKILEHPKILPSSSLHHMMPIKSRVVIFSRTTCYLSPAKEEDSLSFEHMLKVVGNEKVGGSGMCQTVSIWLGPRRSRFVSLSILPSSLILSISVSAPVKQNE